MTLNHREANVGERQEVWDKARYKKSHRGAQRREGVEREINWNKVCDGGMRVMTTSDNRDVKSLCCYPTVNDILKYKIKIISRD